MARGGRGRASWTLSRAVAGDQNGAPSPHGAIGPLPRTRRPNPPECGLPVRLRRGETVPGQTHRFSPSRSMSTCSRSHLGTGVCRGANGCAWPLESASGRANRASLPDARPGEPGGTQRKIRLRDDAGSGRGMCRFVCAWRAMDLDSGPASKLGMPAARSLDSPGERPLSLVSAPMDCPLHQAVRTPIGERLGAPQPATGARA